MIILIVAMCLVCVAVIAWGFTGVNRSLRYGCLFAMSMAGFAVPQVVGLNNAGGLPDGALEMFVIMAILCMVCAMAGDLWGHSHPGTHIRRATDYDERRVTEGALILIGIALFSSFFIQVTYRDEIVRRIGSMSGPMVIVSFFGAVNRYAFALALMLYWRRQSTLPLLMVLFGAANYLMLILMNARRGPAIEFVFIVMLTYAMIRRKKIPAVVVTVLFVVGTLWSTNISHFRDDSLDLVEKVETAEPLKGFTDVWERGGLEVQNGAEVIWNAYETRDYEFGKYHWNKVIHAYFPGQIFGHDEKRALMFDLEDVAEVNNLRRGTVGAARTSMADCFTSFGYFGCLKYFLIGAVMGRWYRRAFQGDLIAQLACSTLMSAALHTISHGTAWFVNEFIHMGIFSYPLLYWARKPAAVGGGAIRRRPVRLPPGVTAPGLR